MRHLCTWLGITKNEVVRLAGLVLAWRIGLFILALLAPHFLPYLPSFPYAASLLAPSGYPAAIYSFANFDGVHYLTIAKEGYLHVNFIQAFFPLFPLAILRPLSLLTPHHPPILTGIIATSLFALTAILLLFALIKERTGSAAAWRACVCLLLFPTSFFLGSLYNTSLLLTLILIALFAAMKRHWGVAAGATLLACATHISGILLIPALLLTLIQAHYPKATMSLRTTAIPLLLILLSSIGLGSYMLYLFVHFHDPLLFFHAQSSFGAGRSTHLVLYPQVVWRSSTILILSQLDFKYIAYLQEFLAGTLGLLGIIMSSFAVRRSWLVFALLAFFLPPLTGTMSSMGRYLLICLPLFCTLALLKNYNKYIYWGWLGISTLLLVINTMLFIQGYWVA